MFGRFERQVTVPVGGWDADFTDAAEGPITITIPAGDYWPDELLQELEDQLNADFAASVWTVTADFASKGTGQVTIESSEGDVSITWTDTDERDCLGYTVNIVGEPDPVVSTNGMQAVFLPDTPFAGGDFDPEMTGRRRSDATYAKGPTGKLFTWEGNTYRSFRGVILETLTRARALDVGSALVSWEEWVTNTQRGGEPYFEITDAGDAPEVRIYSDATANTLVGAAKGGDGIYTLHLPADIDLARATEGWAGGYYTVEIIEMIKV